MIVKWEIWTNFVILVFSLFFTINTLKLIRIICINFKIINYLLFLNYLMNIQTSKSDQPKELKPNKDINYTDTMLEQNSFDKLDLKEY